MLPISAGIQVSAPPLTAGGFTPARIPALSASLNPASFSRDLVTPYVQGVKAGQEIIQPIADAMEYSSPENRALRAAKIAIAKSQAETAPMEAAFNKAKWAAETPLLGQLEKAQISNALAQGGLLNLEGQTKRMQLDQNKALFDLLSPSLGDKQKTDLEKSKAETDKIKAEAAAQNFSVENQKNLSNSLSSLIPTTTSSVPISSAVTPPMALPAPTPNTSAPVAPVAPVTGNPVTAPTEPDVNQVSNRVPTDDERAVAGKISMLSSLSGRHVDETELLNSIHKQKTGVYPYTKEQQSTLHELNDKFRSTDTVKNVDEAISALARIKSLAGDQTGSSDLALVDLMNQIVNKPGIKVTEGNVKLIEGTVPGTTKINPIYWKNMAMKGTFLSPDIRQQFANMADKMVGASVKSVVNGPLSSFRTQAKREGIDPQDIGSDYDRYSSMFTNEKGSSKTPKIKTVDDLYK